VPGNGFGPDITVACCSRGAQPPRLFYLPD